MSRPLAAGDFIWAGEVAVYGLAREQQPGGNVRGWLEMWLL